MAQTRDLYEVLGVSRDATQEEIRRAYRRLARKYHPDVSDDPEAEHRFKEINLAYQTLSDPARRRQYDMYGGEGFTPDMFDFADVSDIFEMFFGSPFRRGRRSARPSRGEDLRLSLTLTFEEAAFGVEKEIEVETLASCEACDGTGREPGTEVVRCLGCGGTGEVSDVRRSVFGTVMTSRICATCGGTGQLIPSPCRACGGEGRVPQRRTITVDVPAGVSDGVELRIEGSGHQGRRGAPPGDLFLALRVRPHPVFERRGQDLVAVLEVPLTQAILGGEVEIETLDGPEVLKIPPGTKPGTVVRLGGRGVPNLGRRGRGDLFVELDVQVPAKLSKRERELVERLAPPPVSLPHFFAGAPEPEEEVVLEGEDGRHAVRSLRLTVGDRLVSGDGLGALSVARIVEVARDRVRAVVEERREVPPEIPRLTVVLAAPKGDRLSWAVQKLTEVGTDRIVLAESARSVRRWSGGRAARARERAEAIAREAAKQSRRARLPEVAGPVTWAEALGEAEGPVILLWEGATEGLASVLPEEAPPVLTIAVGPEGGITEEEARDAERRGAALAALGLTILRTETAALAGASIALARYGRLGDRPLDQDGATR